MTTMLRPGQRILHVPGIGISTSRRAVESGAATGWWTVAGKTCVAAYQPKGAASYAASKVNLANPGTYDAADGAAYPSLVAGGWKSAGSQYLTTGITPADSWTMIMRTDGAASEYSIAGAGLLYSTGFGLAVNDFGVFRFTNGATNVDQSSFNRKAAVVAVAGKEGYWWADFGSGNRTIAAGALVTGTIDICRAGTVYGNGIICALAIYSDTLTAGEVGTVKTAMDAL